MNTHEKINQLWEQMRDSIDSAYKAEQADPDRSGDALCGALRDYARDISWSDNLAALLGRETANERQHRRNRTSPKGFSIQDAAKLIVMNCFRCGADGVLPSAIAFLIFRQTAVEAETVGFLCKAHVDQPWKSALAQLDYAKLMAV